MRERHLQYTLGGMHTKPRTRTALAAVGALVASLVLAACGGTNAIQTVDAPSFDAQTKTAGVTVIDVRTAQEFAAGHIADAINIDVEGAGFEAGIAALDKRKTYAVYCHSGRRSLIAANAMADAGFTSIYNLDGGIIAWDAAGYALMAS